MNKSKNFKWGGLHPFSYHPIIFHFIPDLKNMTILDCGCGRGVWGYLMRASRPTQNSEVIGIDIDEDYLNFCKQYNVYDRLIKSSIDKLPIKDNSIDLVICSEVVEHLKRKKGERFFKEVDRVMKDGGRAIITTPNINVKTSVKSGHDAHHSVWKVSDFRSRGYRVYGMGLRIPSDYKKWYTTISYALGYAFTPISFKIPSLGGFLIAIKDY